MERVVGPSDELTKQYDELLRASREALVKDRQRADAFASLLKHPGWKLYVELLGSLIQDRGSLILAPAGSVDGAVFLEHVKGTMNGLILARDLLPAIIQSTPATKQDDDDAN